MKILKTNWYDAVPTECLQWSTSTEKLIYSYETHLKSLPRRKCAQKTQIQLKQVKV